MSQNLLFISRDPGGTNQLVSLYDILLGPENAQQKLLFEQLALSEKPKIKVYAKDFAVQIWQQNGLSPISWDIGDNEKEIIKFLEKNRPDQIITSTCHVDDRTEQMIWEIARSLDIKSMAFLDSDLNIALRFQDDNGAYIFPDRVSVINHKAIEQLQKVGLCQSEIFVGGDLFQLYSKKRAKEISSDKIREKWKVMEGEQLILFASDYIMEMQKKGVSFEVTEFEALDYLIDYISCGKGREKHSGPVRLIIRPHPKDTEGKYDHYLSKEIRNIKILIDHSASSLEAVKAVDVVAGLGSSLLKEKSAIGGDILNLGPMVKRRKGRKKTVS